MEKATAVVHVGPAAGARFTQYTAEINSGGCLGVSSWQRFIYVLEGTVEIGTDLVRSGYAYIPATFPTRVRATAQSRLLVIEKPYQRLTEVMEAEFLVGTSDEITPQPLMGDESVEVRALLPDSPKFDFAVNFMKFQPGASLPMVQPRDGTWPVNGWPGGGIYRLGDCCASGERRRFYLDEPSVLPAVVWGDWEAAAEYIIYKDWNRHTGV